MQNNQHRFLIWVALVALALSTLGHAQATLTSTTLSAPITSTSANTISVTSATGFTARTTFAFVDREYMAVVAVSGTSIRVIRGSSGTAATTHASGATIYVGPGTYFSGSDRAGSCTSTDELVLPVINIKTGTQYQCTGSLWVISNGPGTQGTGLTSLGPNAAGTVDVGSTSLGFRDIFLAGSSGTPATNRFRFTGASTSGLRTITFPDASGTLPLTVYNDCGTANACSATLRSTTMKVVTGITAALDGATPSVAAVTGMPAFTGTATYHCTASLQGATAAIAAKGVAVSNVSATAVTFTSAAAATEKVEYTCVGW